MKEREVTLAITGASGAQYGLRLLEILVKQQCQIKLLISSAASIVIATETDLQLAEDVETQQAQLTQRYSAKKAQIQMFSKKDWFASVASGSGAPASMVICPASGGTISSLASGASNNLIERAGDVVLKERRQLIIVPREAPYSDIHLENMLKLSRMGATILPASPGFYHKPKSLEDLVDFIVARILDHLEIEHALMDKWGRSE